jgi:predicted enzyme related to lactoylglutathione lyase
MMWLSEAKMSNLKVVNGFRFALIYVDKLEECQAFYEKYLGFEKTDDFGTDEIYGRMGDIEVWMGGNYRRDKTDELSTRASVMLGVESVGKLFASLKADGVRIIQEEPKDMGPAFWVQFEDPAGNIVEVLGAE